MEPLLELKPRTDFYCWMLGAGPRKSPNGHWGRSSTWMLLEPCCLEMTVWDKLSTGEITEPDVNPIHTGVQSVLCLMREKLVDIKPIAVLVCFDFFSQLKMSFKRRKRL
jgi:hypothetical protein